MPEENITFFKFKIRPKISGAGIRAFTAEEMRKANAEFRSGERHKGVGLRKPSCTCHPKRMRV